MGVPAEVLNRLGYPHKDFLYYPQSLHALCSWFYPQTSLHTPHLPAQSRCGPGVQGHQMWAYRATRGSPRLSGLRLPYCVTLGGFPSGKTESPVCFPNSSCSGKQEKNRILWALLGQMGSLPVLTFGNTCAFRCNDDV